MYVYISCYAPGHSPMYVALLLYIITIPSYIAVCFT